MGDSPILQTSRLKLRQVREDDAQSIFEYARNPNVLRYTTAETPRELADTIPFVMGAAHRPADKYAWGMCLKNSDQVFGVIEFGVKGNVGSIDYGMSEEFWNQGLMTEAVQSVLNWAFAAHPNMAQVRTAAMTVNIASRRVMEKCGMRHVETVREHIKKFAEPVEQAVYAVSREHLRQESQGAKDAKKRRNEI